jgi:hypothetical protein
MVLIQLYIILYFQVCRHQLTRTGLTGMLLVYTLFLSCWLLLNFCPVVALDPSMLPTNLGHCLDALSNCGSGREPCTAKVFSPCLGVLSRFVFQHHSPGDTTLSERGQTYSILQGWHCITTNWSTRQIGLQTQR